jgi:hypothetical protein
LLVALTKEYFKKEWLFVSNGADRSNQETENYPMHLSKWMLLVNLPKTFSLECLGWIQVANKEGTEKNYMWTALQKASAQIYGKECLLSH